MARGDEVRTWCPECSPEHRSKDKTLGANIRTGSFHCFRCGWKGLVGGEYRNVIPLEPKRKERDADRKQGAIARVLAGTAPISDPSAEIGREYLRTRLTYELTELPKLGFHPVLPYYETAENGRRVGEFPALIATVRDVDGKLVTLHRTYLAADGSGKAPVGSPKKLMSPPVGTVTGCAVRLYEAEGDELILAEGIETALAVAHALDRPAWATVSAHGLATVELPKHIRRLDIRADNDRSGAGQDAALRCRIKLEKEGRSVRVMFPKRQGHDWLDVLREGRT